MLTTLVLFSALMQTNAATPAQKLEDVYRPLEIYQGTWKMVPGGQDRAYDTLVTQCNRADLFYECAQSVNGKFAGLLVFVPAAEKAHYYSQFIRPSGERSGRSDIVIDGDRWTYNLKVERKGETLYHRTVNTFDGNNKIRFSQQASTDGVHFVEKRNGNEQRVDKGREMPSADPDIPESAYKPLELFQGTWRVVPGNDNRAYDLFVNRCRRTAVAYGCTQRLNGTFRGMLVFLPTAAPGQYHSIFVDASARAGGTNDLTIAGDLWTYTEKAEQEGKPIYYRTTNTFTGTDKIHFSQQISRDGIHFTEDSSGDERRITPVM